MSSSYSDDVSVARDYYNSQDADNFYYHIWGGEDIHVGLYQSESEPIFDASRRTVETMAKSLEPISDQYRVLDIGAGFGGAARYLAKTYGCKVVALNLSEAENNRDRQMNHEQQLDHLVDVVDGSFEDIPFPDDSFDLVWSQDAILHSGDREKVLSEVCRVLKPGGRIIFTDPMQSDTCPDGVLQPIYDRIHLKNLASPGFYRETCRSLGLKEIDYTDMTHQLINHYSRVLQETTQRESELTEHVSQNYINNMKKGLKYWIDGGKNGYLAWGIFQFKKG
jgi:sarcosine/dimethylglycine N-methyltransferase